MFNSSPKLIDHASSGNNSYGVMRLFAAILVMLSHAWLITGGLSVQEPLENLTGYPLGAHAVHVFFILSGMMITASFERSRSLFRFVLARILRIYPALLIVSLAIVFISGIALTTAPPSDYWSIGNIGEFLLRNFLFLGGGATLAGVFEHNLISGEINTPLWTLKFEIICYASLALMLGVVHWFMPQGKKVFYAAMVSATVVLIAFLSHINPPSYHDSHHFDHLVRMGFAFYLGSLAWHLRAWIALSPRIVLATLAPAIILTLLDLPFAEQMQIVFLAYAVLWLGHLDFGWLKQFTDRQDYSYGVYIIGFPIQQALVYFYGPMDPLQNFFIAAPIALLLAAVSWNLIEKPAMKLKNMRNAAAKQRRNIDRIISASV